MHKINFLPTKGNACDAFFFISSINSLILVYFQWKLRCMLKQICQFNFDPCLCSKCAWVRKQHSSFCKHSILKKIQTYCLIALANVLSVLRFTARDYRFEIFKLLTIVFSALRFSTSDYAFDIFKLLAIALSILQSTVCDYPFGIFTRLFIALSVLKFTASDYSFGIFKHLAITFSALRVTDF